MPHRKTPPPDFDVLKASQAWAYLGCSKTTFYRAVACHLIPKATPTLAGPRWVRCDLDQAKENFARQPKKWQGRMAKVLR